MSLPMRTREIFPYSPVLLSYSTPLFTCFIFICYALIYLCYFHIMIYHSHVLLFSLQKKTKKNNNTKKTRRQKTAHSLLMLSMTRMCFFKLITTFLIIKNQTAEDLPMLWVPDDVQNITSLLQKCMRPSGRSLALHWLLRKLGNDPSMRRRKPLLRLSSENSKCQKIHTPVLPQT